MTSLEIVDKLLKEQKEDYYELYNSDSWCPNLLSSVKIRIKELETIKQDLEVLYLFAPYLFSCLSDDKKNILIGLHDIIDRDLSETDKLFIRTWLKNKNLNVYDELGDSQ